MRLADGRGGYAIKNLAQADDLAAANGTDVLDFWQAQQAARQLGAPSTAPETAITTVDEAIKRYEADLRTRGGDVGNAKRLRGHLLPAMMQRPVGLLTSMELRRWRDLLATKLSPAAVNRTATCLKACLNLVAAHDERITCARAWKTGLAALANAHRARNTILSEARVRRIIVEARRVSPEFGLLVEVAAVTGARISQLARLEIQDLVGDGDTAKLSVPASKKGRGPKAISHYAAPIGAALAVRLRLVAADRPAASPLLLQANGESWGKTSHVQRPFARAAEAAGENGLTMYVLRHSSIVRALLGGVPIRLLAVAHDTSVVMIERTYSANISNHSDAIMRGAMLDIGDDAGDGQVIPLRGQR